MTSWFPAAFSQADRTPHRHTGGVAAGRTVQRDLLNAVRTASGYPDAQWARAPKKLDGGSWADIYRVRLRHAPGLEGDLVVRVMPEPDSWEREMLVQGWAAKQGFPAPAVHLGALPSAEFDRAWMLMDYSPGERLFSKPNVALILTSALRPRMRAPRLLADVTVAIHAIGAGPIARDLAAPRTVGPGLNWFYSRASALGDRALVDKAQRLLATRPAFRGAVLCHGDIHPLNILRDGPTDTVIDWTHAQYDDPLYDVAFTHFALSLIPVRAPGWMRPAISAFGRAQAKRFLTAYEKASGTRIDPARLDWFTRVVALRILIEAEEARRKGITAESRKSAGLMYEPFLLAAGF